MKWIKVEDELPKELLEVLCINNREERFVGWMCCGFFNNFNAYDNNNIDLGKVTHWAKIDLPY